MEEKINNGFKLYVKKNPETNQIYGEYIRQANGATTTQQVQEHELDFLEMFCEIDKELSIGHYLEVGKMNTVHKKEVEIEILNLALDGLSYRTVKRELEQCRKFIREKGLKSEFENRMEE